MNFSRLLTEIESYGVTLKTDGRKIFFKPKNALPEKVMECIKEQKSDIISHLQGARNNLRVFSKVLGEEVTISWFSDIPNVVYVNRTPYTTEEIARLKGAGPKDVRAVHLTREAFNGEITDKG